MTLPDGTRLLGVHASPGRDDGPGINTRRLGRRARGAARPMRRLDHFRRSSASHGRSMKSRPVPRRRSQRPGLPDPRRMSGSSTHESRPRTDQIADGTDLAGVTVGTGSVGVHRAPLAVTARTAGTSIPITMYARRRTDDVEDDDRAVRRLHLLPDDHRHHAARRDRARRRALRRRPSHRACRPRGACPARAPTSRRPGTGAGRGRCPGPTGVHASAPKSMSGARSVASRSPVTARNSPSTSAPGPVAVRLDPHLVRPAEVVLDVVTVGGRDLGLRSAEDRRFDRR